MTSRWGSGKAWDEVGVTSALPPTRVIRQLCGPTLKLLPTAHIHLCGGKHGQTPFVSDDIPNTHGSVAPVEGSRLSRPVLRTKPESLALGLGQT